MVGSPLACRLTLEKRHCNCKAVFMIHRSTYVRMYVCRYVLEKHSLHILYTHFTYHTPYTHTTHLTHFTHTTHHTLSTHLICTQHILHTPHTLHSTHSTHTLHTLHAHWTTRIHSAHPTHTHSTRTPHTSHTPHTKTPASTLASSLHRRCSALPEMSQLLLRSMSADKRKKIRCF